MYSLTCVFVLIYIIQKTEGFVETFNISSLPHKNVTLKCTFKDDTKKNIFVIQWKKDTSGTQSSYIASIQEINDNNEDKRPEIKYFNYSNVNVTCDKDMRTTTLTIINITRQNESCFTCNFKVTKETATEYTNRTCINLYDTPTLALTSTLSNSNKGNITCLSTGYFQPSVKWINVSGVNNLTENITNYNGTTSVKNTIYVDMLKEEICCKNNIGNVTCVKPYRIHKENLNELITTTCIVLFIIITALGITIYWYYIKRRNKRTKNTDYTKMKL
nr:glycoprotein vOX2-2 [Elephant endotheliotropic herpesvirus 5B]